MDAHSSKMDGHGAKERGGARQANHNDHSSGSSRGIDCMFLYARIAGYVLCRLGSWSALCDPATRYGEEHGKPSIKYRTDTRVMLQEDIVRE